MVSGHIVAGRTVHVRPNSRVCRHGGRCKQAVGSSEEIAQRLAFAHSSIAQYCRWAVASDTVLALDHIPGTLPGVGLAEFGGHVGTGISMTACPPLRNN